MRRAWVRKDLQHDGNRRTGNLLQSRDALSERFPSSFPVSFLEIRILFETRRIVKGTLERYV